MPLRSHPQRLSHRRRHLPPASVVGLGSGLSGTVVPVFAPSPTPGLAVAVFTVADTVNVGDNVVNDGDVATVAVSDPDPARHRHPTRTYLTYRCL